MSDSLAPDYEVVIEPSRATLQIDWRELWEYRDLLMLLVQRDFNARYKQTLLGPLWFIAQPVLTTIVFAIFFGRIAGIPTDGVPAPLFYMCGLLGWNYFAQNITTAGSTFVNNQALFTKVWFPRLIMPAAAVASNMIAVALQFGAFLGFFAWFAWVRQEPGAAQLTWRALLVPLPLLHLAALSLGISLWMAASTAKYRDLIHLNQFVVQLWMFATPVIYPLSKVPPHWAWLVWLNPVSVPVEAVRVCLLNRGTVDPLALGISLAMTAVLLFTGIIVFQRSARSAVDTI